MNDAHEQAYAHLRVRRDGAVARVKLDRPERLNALNPALVGELLGFFEGLYRDTRTRVVVLEGAGRAFCAGLDLKDMQPSGARKRVGEVSWRKSGSATRTFSAEAATLPGTPTLSHMTLHSR